MIRLSLILKTTVCSNKIIPTLILSVQAPHLILYEYTISPFTPPFESGNALKHLMLHTLFTYSWSLYHRSHREDTWIIPCPSSKSNFTTQNPNTHRCNFRIDIFFRLSLAISPDTRRVFLKNGDGARDFCAKKSNSECDLERVERAPGYDEAESDGTIKVSWFSIVLRFEYSERTIKQIYRARMLLKKTWIIGFRM